MTKTAFLNCNLFVGNKDNLVSDAWFVVDDETGKLTAQGSGKFDEKVDKTVDLDGQYVMSGLINAHTHIGSDRVTNRNFPQTETTVTYNALHNLKEGLQGGVTYIRSCGVPFDVDIKLKEPEINYRLKAQVYDQQGCQFQF